MLSAEEIPENKLCVLNSNQYMSHVMRKLDFCICENKAADQLCSNCTADQRLCFRYTDSRIPLLLVSIISSFQPAFVTVQASLCRTWWETLKTCFLASRLIKLKVAFLCATTA